MAAGASFVPRPVTRRELRIQLIKFSNEQIRLAGVAYLRWDFTKTTNGNQFRLAIK
ncbi:hypothetical protein KIN20_005728 [Parelaphostrongylus tenuis]|uniref:Uncharacterized protein n=1 Tax=Parelaphostrongylus tenuis TaxID=148309 RepID=A0AAD5M4Z1_PARTN|nr:hypothetical protein KIN20_005728 [Parelaphostrongylus tenuis]